MKHKIKKHLGQNFLENHNYLRLMAEKLEISPNDNIVEIGPGRGEVTTKALKYKPKIAILYEFDAELITYLERLKPDFPSTNIIIKNESILDSNIDADTENQSYKLIGSLPYYITSPIFHKILNLKNKPKVMILLIQKEVAEKILSQAPKASYWTHVIAGYTPEKIALVKAENFHPVPNVDSMIIKLKLDENISKEIDKIGFIKWSKFLHRVYQSPRKMIKKFFNLENLVQCNINPDWRAQNLELHHLLELYRQEHEFKKSSTRRTNS